MMPSFSPPSGRRAVMPASFTGGVSPSAPPNSCNCSGDSTYNKCQMSSNNCDPGYYPVCDCGSYNSSCTCKPA